MAHDHVPVSDQATASTHHPASAHDHVPVSDHATGRTHNGRTAHDAVAVSDSVSAVFLRLAPAIARSGGSLELTTLHAAVAELTPEQRATWESIKAGAGGGATLGGVVGGAMAAAGLGSWWPIIGVILGSATGPTALRALRGRHATTRMIAAITDRFDPT
jgi:hypothetical protein